MTTKFTKIGIAAALALCCFNVSAEELLLTAEKAGGNSALSLDFVTEGQAVAFQFNIKLPKGVTAAQVDLKSCLSQLPKSHTGNCVLNEKIGEIIATVYNDQNVRLPAGVVSVGHISLKGVGADAMEVSQFLVSDAKAQPISSKATFSGGNRSAKPGTRANVD